MSVYPVTEDELNQGVSKLQGKSATNHSSGTTTFNVQERVMHIHYHTFSLSSLALFLPPALLIIPQALPLLTFKNELCTSITIPFP